MDKNVVELFAGVGGFRCGFNHVSLNNGVVKESENWNFIWANQWEPSTKTQAAFDCYAERFGDCNEHMNEDICTIDKNIIPNHSVLVGGFPCQDYSVARTSSNEKGIEGKKGVLWWEIAEVLEVKRPPFVLLENVDRLLRSPARQRGRDFGVMLRTFHDYGYSVEWRVINAAEYGFTQKRRRVFIFAYHESTKYCTKVNKISSEEIVYNEGIFSKNFKIKSSKLEKGKTDITSKKFKDVVSVSDDFEFHFYNAGVMKKGIITTYKVEANEIEPVKLGDLMEKEEVDDKYFLEKEPLEKLAYLKGPKKIKRKDPSGKTYIYSEGGMVFPDNLDWPARTMLTSESTINRSSHVVKDYKTGKLRKLTPIEAERIQMFPDDWTNVSSKAMTERRRYFIMGNALVVGIVEKLGDYLLKIIENEE